MFYYQEFRTRWERFKSKLDEIDVKEYDKLDFSTLLESLDTFLNQILDYAERKPKKKEKFYLRLLNELCENIPDLMWGEDEDDDFEETIYIWKYDDKISYDSDISRSGYTSYEELAKDIMLHLEVKK